jgi:hypothetical protein
MSKIRVRKRERVTRIDGGELVKQMTWELDDGSPIEENFVACYSQSLSPPFMITFGNPKDTSSEKENVMSFHRDYLVKLRDMLTRVLRDTDPQAVPVVTEVNDGT